MTPPNYTEIDAAGLRRAAEITERIETLQEELVAILGGESKPGRKAKRKYTRRAAKKGAVVKKKKAKRKMSAAGRAAIRAAQARRWAKKKKKSEA